MVKFMGFITKYFIFKKSYNHVQFKDTKYYYLPNNRSKDINKF